jgi:Helix-turn-helix domain
VSIEAITWALNAAPIPSDRRDASSLAIVLVGLANHADPEGRNAFPAVATLVRYTRLSERTVRYALHALEDLSLIVPSDPEIVAAYVKRADRRPNGWDLLIHNPIHRVIHTPGDEVQPMHPADQHGVQTQARGVQLQPSRGAEAAPEPSLNHPGNRPARGRGRERARPDAGSGLPPVCGQCDARNTDPVSARVVWLDDRRERSKLCPLCHPQAASTGGAQ